MRHAVLILATLWAAAAYAAEPTLNDIPGILLKLRICAPSTFSGYSCQIADKDLWVAISSAGDLTLFRRRAYGDIIFAHGKSVSALLRDFAAKINEERDTQKAMLDAMAPFLPSQ